MRHQRIIITATRAALCIGLSDCQPVQAVSEDIFIRTVRPRRIVDCLIAPPRNILTYLYLLRYKSQLNATSQLASSTVTTKPIWLSGNALVAINVVTLHQARVVHGWVTVMGRVNHLGAEPGTARLVGLSYPSVSRRYKYQAKTGLWE